MNEMDKMARVASAQLAAGTSEQAFYETKLVTARYFMERYTPETGSLPSISRCTLLVSPPPAPPRPPPFIQIRLGCQGVSWSSCSGKALASPASLNASTANTADAV